MKQSILSFLLLSACLTLTACQTASKPQPRKATTQRQDFMTVGRGLSDGSVDLYQPGTDFLPTAQFPTTGRRAQVSPIPGNSNIIVNDPSVTIYSLDTMEISEPAPAPLPPLQPPVSLQGDYPSPFDKNGNPTR